MSLLSNSPDSLIDFLLARGIEPPTLGLVDVGVSGGLQPVWRKWGGQLAALGIDVIPNEIDRLSANETNSSVRYVAARAGPPAGNPAAPARGTNYALHRSQAYLATAVLGRPAIAGGYDEFVRVWRETVGGSRSPPPTEANYSNVADPMADPFFGYYARRFAQIENVSMTDRLATVDGMVAESKFPERVDVLKIDTDGWDFDVLRGAEKVLAAHCLAVEIETQFHGPISPTSNVFCNIDSFLRDRGFTLFKLDPAHYGRSALPRRFLYEIPAQTESGQIVWADALYIRDLAGQSRSGIDIDADRLRRLALILDLYGLEDAAAELLLASPGLFGGDTNEPALDFLAQKVHGPGITWRQVAEAFLADPIGFHSRLGTQRGR